MALDALVFACAELRSFSIKTNETPVDEIYTDLVVFRFDGPTTIMYRCVFDSEFTFQLIRFTNRTFCRILLNISLLTLMCDLHSMSDTFIIPPFKTTFLLCVLSLIWLSMRAWRHVSNTPRCLSSGRPRWAWAIITECRIQNTGRTNNNQQRVGFERLLFTTLYCSTYLLYISCTEWSDVCVFNWDGFAEFEHDDDVVKVVFRYWRIHGSCWVHTSRSDRYDVGWIFKKNAGREQ